MDRLVTRPADGDHPPVRVVLQSRLSSSRLPAKALLPVGGMPLAALAARRVMRGGGDVVLATSDDPSDDLLAAEMARWGVPVVRGPLDDVLARFVLATADLADRALCVRLTGDNCFPDAGFVATLVGLLVAGGHRYMGYGGDCVQLPYGMAAEVFTVAVLRAAAADSSDPLDREHVTPSIRRQYKPAAQPRFPGPAQQLGHLRCTVDTFDDYQHVAGIFAQVADPVGVPWQDLVGRLQAVPGAPAFHIRPAAAGGGAAMVLGTVQLGLPYGRANATGLPPETLARDIVLEAIAHGITDIDTARAYGQSEARLGRIMAGGWTSRARLLTKLDPLAAVQDDWPDAAVVAAVDASVLGSAQALRLPALPVVMLHRAAHLTQAGGRVWRRLLGLQQTGLIGQLGASVQSPAELRLALAAPEIRHVQLPFNILDWRWDDCAPLLAARADVTVHVRSAYLQGLLTPADPAVWPAVPGADAPGTVAALNALAQDLGRDSVRDLCLAFVRSRPWINGVVIGVETLAQLRENLALFRRPALTQAEADSLRDRLPRAPEMLLDPGRWPRG